MQSFPQYRKYSNNSSYFKILSLDRMHEKKQLGTNYLFFEIRATQYYERLQIQDLLDCTFAHLEVIDSADYDLIPITQNR